jgi:hypothetical protein
VTLHDRWLWVQRLTDKRRALDRAHRATAVGGGTECGLVDKTGDRFRASATAERVCLGSTLSGGAGAAPSLQIFRAHVNCVREVHWGAWSVSNRHRDNHSICMQQLFMSPVQQLSSSCGL